METICWTSHSQALNCMKARHVQLVKLCNNILPTATIVHHSNPRSPSSCILYHHDTKDLNHLLRCDHPQRKLWRSKLYAALQDAYESFSTRESLIDPLILGLDAWLLDQTLNPADFPSQITIFLPVKLPLAGVKSSKADFVKYGLPSKTNIYKKIASTIPTPQESYG